MSFFWKLVKRVRPPQSIAPVDSIAMDETGQKQFYLLTDEKTPNNNKIYASFDYGKSFEATSATINIGNLAQLLLNESGRLLIVLDTIKSIIYLSEDFGYNLEPIQLDNKVKYQAMFGSVDLKTIVVTSNTNNFFSYSIDSGQTFETKAHSSRIDNVGIYQNTITYLATNTSSNLISLMQTFDYWETSTNISNSVLNLATNGSVFIPNLFTQYKQFMICCTKFGDVHTLWHSINFGKTWIKIYTLIPLPVRFMTTGKYILILTKSTMIESQDQGKTWDPSSNPPNSIQNFSFLKNIKFSFNLKYFLANDESNIFRSCSNCLQVRSNNPCVLENDKRRTLQTRCGAYAQCKYGNSKQKTTNNGEDIKGFWEYGATATDALKPWYRQGDECSGQTKCSSLDDITTSGCAGPLQKYYYNVCEQDAIQDQIEDKLKFTCSLDMKYDDPSKLKYCCTAQDCLDNQIQDLDDFVPQCITYKDEKATCETMGIKTTSLNTVGSACDSAIEAFCVIDLGDDKKDYKNMSNPECVNWCKNAQADKTPGSTLGKWCDAAMDGYCNTYGYANPEIGKPQDPQCNCVLSKVQRAICIDPICTNTNAYQLQSQLKELQVSGSCPNMCIQSITVDNVKGNVGVDKNTFYQQCNFEGKVDPKTNKPYPPLNEWYTCNAGVCELAPVGSKGELGNSYLNDNYCGNNCAQKRFDCVEGKCQAVPGGQYLESTCQGQCLRFSCVEGKCQKTPNGGYSEPTCSGTCEQVEPDVYFAYNPETKKCQLSNTVTEFKNDPSCNNQGVENETNWLMIGLIIGGVVLLIIIIIVSVVLVFKKKQKIK